MKKLFFALCLLCFIFPLRPCAAELFFFADGKASACLDLDFTIFPDAKNSLIQPCLDDFRNYFQRLSGVELPSEPVKGLVLIKAALETDPAFNPQHCKLSVREDSLVLSASSSTGIVNGLYTLLDKWGCRWVLPGEMGEVIPKVEFLSLPLGEELLLIAMDSRVDSSWRQDNEHPDWRRRNRRGNDHWLTSQHYWHYAFPAKDYFQEHPEYYALIGGKRVPTQLCTSNPEVRRLMLQKALDYLRKRPSVDSFPMDPADNYDHCQCENCLKLDVKPIVFNGVKSVTDRVAAFANFVAEGISKEFPDKKVGFYAYANKKLPPSIELHKNIFVPYTRDSSSLIHLTPDPEVPSSLEYWQLLRQWQEKCDNMYAYEYDPVSWIGSLPCPIYLERAKALQRQYAMGIKGVINDQGPRADATLFVNRYMEARFRSNPTLDPERELEDMCTRFFAPAGQPMYKYYLTLAKINECKIDTRFGIENYERIFTPEMLKSARDFLNQAHAISSKLNDAMLLRRLEMVELAQRYLESFLFFNWNLANADYAKSLQDSEAIFAAIEALASKDENFLAAADAKRRLTAGVKKNLAKTFPEQMRFIRDWQMLGPFSNESRDAIIVAEQPVFKDGMCLLNDAAASAQSHHSLEGFIDFRAAFREKHDDSIPSYGYALTSIFCAEARSVKFLTDSFHPFKVWLNNKQVYVRPGPNADCPDYIQFTVSLQEGQNHIAVLVAEGAPSLFVRWGFWLRLADAKGRIISLQELAQAQK